MCRDQASAVRAGGGAQGWNINYGDHLVVGAASVLLIRGDGTSHSRLHEGGRLGTLLGPEGTARLGVLLRTGPVGRSNRRYLVFGRVDGRRR